MSQQPWLGARRTEIKCFKHSQNKSCITDVLMFYLLIYFTFASHRKMVRDGFSFSVPTAELTKLAKCGELHRNQEEKASWLAGFSIAFSAVLQWLLWFILQPEGTTGHSMGTGGGEEWLAHGTTAALESKENWFWVERLCSPCSLGEGGMCWGPWHCMGIMVKGREAGCKYLSSPGPLGLYS